MAQTQTASANGGAAPATDLRALLSKPSSEVERPRALPDGTYYATFLGHEIGKAKSGTDRLRFNMKLEGPGDDIQNDEDKMFQIAGIDWARRQMPVDYYITENSLWRLVDMLDAVLGEPERPSDERIEELRGTRVLMTLRTRLNQDGTESTFNECTSMVRG